VKKKNLLSLFSNAASKLEFTNNSANLPKYGNWSICSLIISLDLSIHEKNQSSKISCYSPFKEATYKLRSSRQFRTTLFYIHIPTVQAYLYIQTKNNKKSGAASPFSDTDFCNNGTINNCYLISKAETEPSCSCRTSIIAVF